METLKIGGMACGHCVNAVSEALTNAGLANVKVELESGNVTFDNPKNLTSAQINEAVEAIGYNVE